MSLAAAPARTLLCVSPHTPAGGVGDALTAFGLLASDRPSLGLELVGSGPLERALRAHAAQLGLADHVRFAGPRSPAVLRDAVLRCSLLVLPHRALQPARPLPPGLPEALLAGRPVVATAAAVPPDAVRHGESGLVVPPADPVSLALAVTAVLDDPVWAAALAAGGRARLRAHRDRISL